MPSILLQRPHASTLHSGPNVPNESIQGPCTRPESMAVILKKSHNTEDIRLSQESTVDNDQRPPKVQNLIMRLKPLESESWSSFRGLEVKGALVIVGLLRDYWQMLFPRFGIVIVIVDDQGLYDTLYHNLFFILRQRPGLGVVVSEIRRLIPPSDSLPSHSDAVAYDEDITGPILDDLRRARAILNQVLIAEGGAFGQSRVDTLFTSLVDEIAMRRRDGMERARKLAIRLGLEPAPASDLKKTPSKAGRPAVKLEYVEAQHAYWTVFDRLEEAGEVRKPTQADICDHLASIGTPIRVTTLGKHIKAWRGIGQPWPPPQPDVDC